MLPYSDDSVYGRSRFAEVIIRMKNGEKIISKVSKSKWSAPEQASDIELVAKYREMVSDYLPEKQ